MIFTPFCGSVFAGFSVAFVLAADVPSGLPEIGTGIGLIAVLIFFLRLFVQDTLTNQRAQTDILGKMQQNMGDTNVALVKLSSLIAEHIRDGSASAREMLDRLDRNKDK